MTRKLPVVALDGPAGAGKSTVSKRVARALGYTLVDTGAMYRAVALAAARENAAWDDPDAVGQVARAVAQREAIQLVPCPEGGVGVFLDGEDVSGAIRTQEMGQGASKVSAIPAVREALLEMQRAAGRAGGVVLEGRDIGSVVFPDAEAKFFLTADVEVRARRRRDELAARGVDVDLAQVEKEVRERDHRDSTRSAAPLVRADDADLVDSSSLTIDEVVERIVAQVKLAAERLATG